VGYLIGGADSGCSADIMGIGFWLLIRRKALMPHADLIVFATVTCADDRRQKL
jgi:hypothetical protein